MENEMFLIQIIMLRDSISIYKAIDIILKTKEEIQKNCDNPAKCLDIFRKKTGINLDYVPTYFYK